MFFYFFFTYFFFQVITDLYRFLHERFGESEELFKEASRTVSIESTNKSSGDDYIEKKRH